MNDNIDKKTIDKTSEHIKNILDDDITTNNIEILYRLYKIRHMAKEGENAMRYNEYNEYRDYNGRGPGHGSYGNYGNYGDNYGRRGYDMKYRGEDELDRMSGEYERYQESRRYGAGEETDKSFHYMVKALEDFIRVLHEEAETEPQRQMLRETLQRSMM